MNNLTFFFIFLFSPVLVLSQEFNTITSQSVSFDENLDLTIYSRIQNSGKSFLMDWRVLGTNGEIIEQKKLQIIGKGVNKLEIKIDQNKLVWNDNDTLRLSIQYSPVNSENKIKSKDLLIKRPMTILSNFNVSDSSIVFQKSSIHFWKIVRSSNNSNKTEFVINTDTTLSRLELVSRSPFQGHQFMIYRIHNKSLKILSQDTLYYQNGQFSIKPLQKADLNQKQSKIEKKSLPIKGNLFIQHSIYSETPYHANNQLYPSTIIQGSNQINLLGLPIALHFSHNTSEGIDPNFKNFFSLSLDVNKIEQQAINKQLKNRSQIEYDKNTLGQELTGQENSLTKLKNSRDILLDYPNENINIDSLYEKEISDLNKDERKDSNLLANNTKDSTLIPNDSSKNANKKNLNGRANQSEINQLDQLIARHEKSISIKKKLLSNDIEYTASSQVDPNSNNSILSNNASLSSIKDFRLGNFYQYASEYSIRDIEIIGVNGEFEILPKTQFKFLSGRINDFQTINLDNSKNQDARISSFALSNQKRDYIQPELRITYSQDKSENIESINNSEEYIITSIVRGNALKRVDYLIELDQSSNNVKEDKNWRIDNIAIKTELGVQVHQSVNLFSSYDQVGSNFNSRGVYFLNRNYTKLGIGSNIKVFKNQIVSQVEYAIITRNKSEKEIDNETTRWYYELSTRFKRYPNILFVHSPVTVSIASQIDTSFSNLTSSTDISIFQLNYQKRVKRTWFYTSMLLNQISYQFNESNELQRSTQFTFQVSKKSFKFNGTSSHNELFGSIRFINLSFQKQVLPNLNVRVNSIKNINVRSPYNWINRLSADFNILKSLKTTIGTQVLLGSETTIIGGLLSLNYTY